MRIPSLPWGITGGGPLLVGLLFLGFVMLVTTLRGERPSTALQPVTGAPVPLYLGEGVRSPQSDWALDAMQVVWAEAPGLAGLPLSAAPTAVVLYPSGEQYRAQVRQWLRRGTEIKRSTCLASPDRVIYCDASAFHSRGDALGAFAQELTYLLLWSDLDRPRQLGKWYSAGVAEHVRVELLTTHEALNATAYWASEQRRVVAALRGSRYLRLEALEDGEAWNAVPDPELAFVESGLAVHRLIERFGRAAVARVVQHTGSGATFARAFGDEFGRSTEAFEAEFRAELLPNARLALVPSRS